MRNLTEAPSLVGFFSWRISLIRRTPTPIKANNAEESDGVPCQPVHPVKCMVKGRTYTGMFGELTNLAKRNTQTVGVWPKEKTKQRYPAKKH